MVLARLSSVARKLLGPLLMLILVLAAVINGAMIMVNRLHVVVVREILDVVRVVVGKVRCVLDSRLVEVDRLKIAWIVEFVVQLGVVAGVFTVEVDVIHGQLIVVRVMTAVVVMMCVIVIMVTTVGIFMLIAHPVFNWQIMVRIICSGNISEVMANTAVLRVVLILRVSWLFILDMMTPNWVTIMIIVGV